jgi:hypothetical protein
MQLTLIGSAPIESQEKEGAMRNRRFRFEAPRVEVTREEILADLTYPVAPAEPGRRPSPRHTHHRPTRRKGRR